MTPAQDHVPYWKRLSGSWLPLLEGKDAVDAMAMLDEIDSYLDSYQVDAGLISVKDAGTKPVRHLPVQMLADNVGRALFYAYLDSLWPDRNNRIKSRKFLKRSVELIGEESYAPHLLGGFTEVAWAACHLWLKMDWSATGNDDFSEVDEYLHQITSSVPWDKSFDLVSGLAGYGVYAIERMPHPYARQILENVVSRLDEIAEKDRTGATWFTPRHHLPEFQKETYPGGHYNMGMSHGVPGVVAFLSMAVAEGILPDVSIPLLASSVDWLLAQRTFSVTEANFPISIAPGAVPVPARLAWCYGDPGIGISILHAGCLTGNTSWIEAAISIGLSATTRNMETTSVTDGQICHGSSGLAHIFNRFWQATGDTRFANASRLWFRDTFERFNAEAGLEGLKAYPSREYILGSDVITGAAGVGLVLIGMLAADAPDWDRILLMGVPPYSSGLKGSV